MISFSHASISFRALLAAVAVVGAAGFVVGRNSRPPFVISPLTLCSQATEAAFPEETPYLRENDAAPAASGALASAPLGASDAYAAMGGNANGSSCAQRYRSYDSASGTFLGHDGHRHRCE